MNIEFELGSATISTESHTVLDRLVSFLLRKPSIFIEIHNHSDERAQNEYSVCLSCIRAKSIAQYLIDKGVNKNRIATKGHEGNQPIIRGAQTEAQHHKNRRTEVVFLPSD